MLKKQRFNQLIADNLRSKILAGVYPVGSLLPTEPVLAAEFGTNRNTLREAMRILETQGFIAVRQGEGVRVVDFRRYPTVELIGYLLAQPTLSPDTANIVVDLLGLRKLLADEIVLHAAGNVSSETAAEIRTLLQHMSSPDITERERTQTDMTILESLVRSTGSIVYAALFNSIYRIFAAGAAQTQGLTTIPSDYTTQMDTVLACLLASDSDRARRAMRALCDASDAVLLQSFQSSISTH